MRAAPREMGELSSYFETAQMLFLLTILQVCGVASIWGYSEILGWRSGYDSSWALVVVVFMFISAFRLITSNFKPSQKLKCISAMVDPAASLRSKDNSMFPRVMKYFGVFYSLLLDFVLQILGTASIWAYSEIMGYRKSPESEKWANVTIFFSFFSLFRYVIRFRRSYSELDLPTRFVLPESFWSYFEAGFVGSLSSKKVIMKSFRVRETHNSLEIACCTNDQPHSSSSSHDSSSLPFHYHTAYSLSLFFFTFGYLCHVALAIVLEGLGSGGAIWGISEVLTLRTTPTSLLFRLLACGVSLVVTTKLLIHFYGSYNKRSGSAGDQATPPPSPLRILYSKSESVVHQYTAPLTHDCEEDEEDGHSEGTE